MRNYFNGVLMVGLMSLPIGCGDRKTFNQNDLSEISSRTETESSDIVLSIVDSKLNNDGEYEIIALGKYKGKVVGLKVRIKDKIIGVEPNGLTFCSMGQESDNLIIGISNLYSFPTSETFSDDDVSFDIYSLNEEQAELSKGNFIFKLFFDPNDEFGLYSELFLRLDLPGKEIVLQEKDEDYRENIIKALTRD